MMKDNKPRTSQLFGEVNGFFISVIAVTLALLLVASIITLMLMPKNTSGEAKPSDDDPKTTTSAPPFEDVIVNTTPLFPTSETRSSYKITTSQSVTTLSGDDFIKSNNTILVKVSDGALTSIVEKDADAKMFPASMTKVMTLIVACERVTDLSKKLTVDAEVAQFAYEQGGSGAGLVADESYKVEDLLYLISYKSDTIASILIAEHIAGSEEAFVALMNEKAQKLGLTGTHFANCTGLYNENNYSTCRDIASIMAYALDNELAYKCLSSYRGRSMKVGGVDCTFYSTWYSGSGRFSDNPKLKTVTVRAAKTGYIDESGMSLVSYATGADGEKYINVIVGKPKGSGLSESMSTSEVKKIYNTYAK